MKCEDYIILINMSVDGEISPEDEIKLQEHLVSCAECRREYDEIKALAGCIRQMGAEPPKELHSSIMSKINGVKQEKIPFYKTRVFGVAVAACLLIAAAGAFLPAAGQMFVPEMADNYKMYSGGDNGATAQSSAAPSGGSNFTADSMLPSTSADMSKAEAWDTPAHLPENTDDNDCTAPKSPNSSGTADIANNTNFILTGAFPLPKEIEKYSLEYYEGEAYIRLSSEQEALEVYKILCTHGFEGTASDKLSQNGLSILEDAENTILIISK